MNDSVLLRLDSISYSYTPEKPVLSDCSLGIREGEFWGIIGPNGAGKSTLLKCAAGIIKPTSGTITLKDFSPQTNSQRERARLLAYLPQHITFEYNYSVEELVGMGRYSHGSRLGLLNQVDRAVITESMRSVAMESMRCRGVMTLSGGERQRTVLASLLAQQARLMLLDEPVNVMDIPQQAAMFQLLRRQVDDKMMGVAAITHDLNVAALFCTHLALLNTGKIVIASTVEDVLQDAHITAVFGAGVCITRHPLHDCPIALPVIS